jgi:putative ABC transport system permease protein
MLRHYLTTALRSFQRRPFGTAINVFALGLGIACFVAAYATVVYWSGAERHFAAADRTYAITANLALRDGSVATGVVPRTGDVVARYLKTDFPELEAVIRARPGNGNDVSFTTGERKARLQLAYVDPDFLDVFDLPFLYGDRATALRQPNSMVLTESAALRLYGTANPVGRFIQAANDAQATVTGVIADIPQPSHMGPSASAYLRYEVLASWDVVEKLLAVARAPNAQPARENWLDTCCVTYVVLPKDGSFDQAKLDAGLADFARRHLPADQAAVADVQFAAVPIRSLMVAGIDTLIFAGNRVAISITTLLMLLGGLVLVVAGLNYANLATAHAAARSKEVGMRKAVGAARSQVMFQYVLEATLLAAAGLAVALAAIAAAAPTVRRYAEVDLMLALTSSAGFWLFLVGVVAGVGALAGAYPAFVLSRVRPADALRSGKLHGGPRLLPALLGGAQFAVASFLLIAVIVMVAQNRELRQSGFGANRDPLVTITNVPFFTRVDPEAFRNALLRIPSVRSVTSVGSIPWSSEIGTAAYRRTEDRSASNVVTYQNVIAHDFFATMDMPVLAGRVFDRDHGEDMFRPQGADPNRPANIVVDRAFAEQLGFPSPQAAVDQIIYQPSVEESGPVYPMRIIGVVENRPMHFLGLGATSNMYLLNGNQWYVIARIAADDIPATRAAIEAAWDQQAPDIAISFRFMDAMFEENYLTFGRINAVFNGLALFALVISAIGLFGMAMHTTGRRLHEIGVRKTLGANARQIGAMLLRSFGKPIVIANLIAWPLAFVGVQAYLRVFLHRITITPEPFLLSLAVTLLIAWIAVMGQTWRASRVAPSRVLRY